MEQPVFSLASYYGESQRGSVFATLIPSNFFTFVNSSHIASGHARIIRKLLPIHSCVDVRKSFFEREPWNCLPAEQHQFSQFVFKGIILTNQQ